MPLIILHLLALSPGVSIPSYLIALKTNSIKPLVASKVIRWIIEPEKLSTHLLNQKWDLLLILPSTTPLPHDLLDKWTHRHWSITAGVPKSLTADFESRNARLLHPDPASIPPLTGCLTNPKLAATTQTLTLTSSLLSWSQTSPLAASHKPVSMLNLLSFIPTPAAHDSYLRYGKAFSSSIGSKRGGTAKLVGKVVPGQGTADEDKYGWDEIALAHYPSTQHFADMLGSEDYQKVNGEWRLPALRDTCILCTNEVDVEEEMAGARARL